MTITAVHRHGEPCNRVAFYYDEVDAPLDRIEAERVTLPDGSRPSPGDAMHCGACGAPIGPEALDLIPGEWNVKVQK